MSNLVPDYIDLDSLEPPRAGERIMNPDEIELSVGPIYNAANMSDDSTQYERRRTYIAALGRAIGDGSTITPRSHPEMGWCLVTRYDPPVSCRPVIAGSADDLSQDWGAVARG